MLSVEAIDLFYGEAQTLDGVDITGWRPDRACHAGIGRTFQIVRPFGGLSVVENVLVGALRRTSDVAAARRAALAILERLGLADKAAAAAHSLTLPERKRLETARALATEPKILLLDEVMAGLRPVEIDRMVEVFAALDLDDKRAMPASALTLPDRKRLEVARALATDPKLLLLDEVMAGLRPTETDRMVAILRKLNRDTGITILLIEHVMRAVTALAGKVLVLHHGATIAEGAPDAAMRDPAVIASYLGAEA